LLNLEPTYHFAGQKRLRSVYSCSKYNKPLSSYVSGLLFYIKKSAYSKPHWLNLLFFVGIIWMMRLMIR